MEDMERAELCNNETQICENASLQHISLSLNIFTILVNILHIILMGKIAKCKQTTYYWILINMSLADIITSVTYSVLASCSLKQIAYESSKSVAEYFLRTRAAVTLATTAVRNFVLAVASYERYVKICLPLTAEDKLLCHLGWVMAVVWAACYGVSLPVFLTDLDDVCYGDFTMAGILNLQSIIVSIILLTVPAGITFVCLFKVGRELKQMMGKHDIPGFNSEAHTAGRYIILICLLFYSSYTPSILAIALNYSDHVSNDTVGALNWASFLVQSLYGTLNIVIYVYMTRGYRMHVLTILSNWFKCFNGCHSSMNSVTPSVTKIST